MTTHDAHTDTTSLHLDTLLVTPEWLAEHLTHSGLRLVDVRPPLGYDEGHIPGAVRLDLSSLDTTVDGVPGMLLPADRFAVQMGRLGIGNDSAVVLYDDNRGTSAARVLWALARYGHTNAAVLTGGIDRWQDEGRPMTTEPTVPESVTFTARADDSHVAPFEWLRDRLEDPNTVVVDTRTPREFGFGHLPGAVCWDYMNGVPAESRDAVRPAAELREELAELGVTPEKEIVTYCRSGARAAHTYLLLRHLGYPRVRLYDGSWLEWSQREQDQK